MKFYFVERTVPSSKAVNQTATGSGWEQVQRSTAKHKAKRGCRFEVSIQALPLELRESQGRARVRIVGCRGVEDTRIAWLKNPWGVTEPGAAAGSLYRSALSPLHS